MREYELWLKGDPDEAAASRFAEKVVDISKFLIDLGPVTPPALSKPIKVAYHDACHLAHAQQVTAQPRSLLRMIPNLELLEIPEGEICCGSAGTYNLEQPEIANDLGRRKVDAILNSEPDAVVSGNIGCMLQIRSHLSRQGSKLPVWHTVELLDKAYLGA